MPEPTYLDLQSVEGVPLRHKYFRQQSDPTGLWVCFPGDNYGVDGPLLYYPSLRLWEAGWDTIAITYGYQSAGQPFSIEVIPDLMEECSSAVRSVLSEREYPWLCLAGKSLGAGVVALLCQALNELDETVAVYLTPPVGTPLFTPVFSDTHQRSLLLIGTADRYYDPEHLENLQKERPFNLVTIPDADHSMNVPGDFPRSLSALELVTEAILSWLGEELATIPKLDN